jgi:acetate---CoA ligase (ADP-forming)
MNLGIDFFHPRSIVVIGASAKEGSYSSRPLKNLIDRGYEGEIYVVNPSRSEVHGVKSYPSVSDLPVAPDMAILVVNASLVAQSLREAGELGIQNAIVIAGGFRESGNSEGEDEITAVAQKYGMAVIGPNCTGMLNFIDNVAASSTLFFRAGGDLIEGPVAVVSQSGGTGLSLLRTFEDRRIGLGYWLSVGNQACVNAMEVVNVLLESPDVRTVALYVEGLGHAGRELLEVGHRATKLGKTVVVLKAGLSSLGQELAQTHTGALSGPGEVTPALLRQAGLVFVETLEDLADVAALESCAKFSGRSSYAIMSTGGGFTVMAADAATKYHIPLATTTEATRAAMRKWVPSFAHVEGNPVDSTAIDTEGNTFLACQALIEAPETDCVLFVLGTENVSQYIDRLTDLADLGREFDTPLVIGLGGVDAYDRLGSEIKNAAAKARLPIFGNPVRAIRSLGLAGRFDTQTRQRSSVDARIKLPPSSPQATFLMDLLSTYGIDAPAQTLTALSEDFQAGLRGLSFPLVAKVLREGDANHKSEAGLVRLNIADIEALQLVVDEFRRRVAETATSLDGYDLLLQDQVVDETVELLVGGLTHPEFGPIVVVGTGGVLAELIDDVSFGAAPLTEAEAETVLMRTKASRLILGYRGATAFDKGACLRAIVAVSRIISEVEELSEIEINPLMLSRNGAFAVDVRAVSSGV